MVTRGSDAPAVEQPGLADQSLATAEHPHHVTAARARNSPVTAWAAVVSSAAASTSLAVARAWSARVVAVTQSSRKPSSLTSPAAADSAASRIASRSGPAGRARSRPIR